MNEYILYLDESKNSKGTVFVIGGFAIKKSEVEKLKKYILTVKKCIWEDAYISNEHPVLHCTDLNVIHNNRKNKNISNIIKNYEFLNILAGKGSDEIKDIYNNVYIKLCEAIKNLNIIPLGCILNLQKYRFIYNNYLDGKYELFFEVAMQQIIENFSYYLYCNNGVGSIVYESRNGKTESKNSNDSKMFDNFCKIKICNKGISFITQKTIFETVKYFNSYSKYNDIAGLQLADFIAYEFMNRGSDLNIGNYPEFTKKIFSRLYNGGFSLEDKDLRHYFGLRSLPFDYGLIISQQSQIERLERANKNLKSEKNRLFTDNQRLKESKQKIIDENNKLLNEIAELKKITKIDT